MYASIRRYKKASAPQLKRSIKEGFLPTISRLPGFVSYSAVDTGNGEWITITIFDTREGAEESNWLAADWITKNLASFIPQPPEVTVGEVVAQRTRSQEHPAMAGAH
jgi:hypothetical protein